MKQMYNSGMKRYLLPLLVTLGLAAGAFGVRSLSPTIKADDSGTRTELQQALQDAVGQNLDAALPYVVADIVIDRLEVSEDGEWAVLWIAAYDRENNEPFGMEPGLGVARYEEGKWRVYLPSDPNYFSALSQVPLNLLPKADREEQLDAAQAVCNTTNIGPLTGYKLPWTGGQALRLTQSIYHTLGWNDGNNPTNSMIHAFDFSTSPAGLFEVRAARPGTVKYFRDSQPNGDDSSPGNYIVLEDVGTNPKSYQLYLHLAQGSIPANLKLAGTPVQQGQVIGVADDTGFSSNHHLHFQVHTEVAWFGCSVDVRFSDVAINAGRPRLPVEAENYPAYGATGQYTYVSGNTDPGPGIGDPGGGITLPTLGATLESTSVNLNGYAFDLDNGLVSAQFAADIGAGWQPVGPLFPFSPATKETQYFSTTLDMCAAGFPDGVLKFGVIVQDAAGTITSGSQAIPVIKRAACSPLPPACVPAANQAALFAIPNYQGDCTLLNVGSHVMTKPAASVLVGKDVSISLYLSSTFRGRSQTFFANDANLANDRSPDVIEAASVQLRTSAPGLPSPSWPSSGEVVPAETSFNLNWHDGGGSQEFQARIVKDTAVITSSWMSVPLWGPGPLTPGVYTYAIRARSTGGTTAWSTGRSFTVQQTNPTAPPVPVNAPWSVDFEGGEAGWFGTGLWKLLSDEAESFNGTKSWWYGQTASDFSGANYDTGKPTIGSLTSPPVTVPGSGYYLRFYSRYETEVNGQNYDRRRVLVSADEGPFVEVYQLDEAVMDSWIRSPYIDLSAYAGKTIRVRFAFETLDRHLNEYNGWLIDQVTIDKNKPAACTAASEPNNTPVTARSIAYGGSFSTELCPVGDVDYFVFSGTAGDRISLDVDAQSLGSSLDPYLVLYDSDGISVLAEVDDEVPAKLTDPILGYTLPRTGYYYVEIRAYSHPGAGTNDQTYTLKLARDQERPVINGLTPSVSLSDMADLPEIVGLSAAVSDSGTGVRSVKFLYHLANFGGRAWVVLGTDTDGSDGWSATWDTKNFPAQPNMVLVVQATDGAGNVSAMGLWDLFAPGQKIYLPITIDR